MTQGRVIAVDACKQAMQDSISNIGQQLAGSFGGPSLQQSGHAQQAQLQDTSQFTQACSSRHYCHC